MATQKELAKRQELLERIMVVFNRDGFARLTMNDLIKVMGVSRRTAYKYFTSKEDVLHAAVRSYLDYIEQLDLPQLTGDDASFYRQLQMLFDQSLTLARTISDQFLQDLRMTDDADYRNLQDALAQQQNQATAYYEAGVERGFFQQREWPVVILQDRVMIRSLIERQFLLRNNLNLKTVLLDYFEMKKAQLLTPTYVTTVNDQPVRLIIEYFVNEYNRTFL